MHSPSCAFENPEGLKFCHKRGAPLRIPCAQCGFVNQPQAYTLRLLGHIGMHVNPAEIEPAKDYSRQACAKLSAAIALYLAMDITWQLPQAKAALAPVEGQ